MADHERQNEPTAADYKDREDEPAAGVVDRAADVDAAYREAMKAAVACIREQMRKNGPGSICEETR